MARPQFTDDELYVIKYTQSATAATTANSYMWGYVLGGAALAAFAAYYQSVPMLLSAFVVVCGFRLYEDRLQLRWVPVWQSILHKYEAALEASDSATDAQEQPTT